MLETSARLLRLLSLMQARRDWTSAELATRLGVTTRTIRNDVGRLRELGYPVDARPGVDGGYRLGAGGALPPLLLDDEEAVAVALGLRTVANGSVAGIEETSVRALAKLQQVLPSRLRRKVSAFQSYVLPAPSGGPQADPDVLTVIASACRAGPPADPRDGRVPGRGAVRVRAGLGPPGDARPVPGNAGRGLQHRRLT